ncbi:epimerase [Candidatus Woesebacteria bacterium RIFCSPHIGHO2_01_FULL_38_9]|uniref:Epimerase n=2 Tax=Candidatus Woeseibacteriota TaxID=1752722 RepID=A0A1F7Y2X5_9BACT|nr:MAG: epimerase [Candidatus Woesebacteria bacterium RIFCSPHIGHO2_01_FULL_38_9]OGM58780.1 MAG: epimerase [Candidatus Woesebacteria bacterium RIFCSPLOWO2_01_FULL_39_10]
MNNKEPILITGANGEVGHGLIPKLSELGNYDIVSLDIRELDEELKPHIHETIVADILDSTVVKNLLKEHAITTIFHLAAILSTGGEKDPFRAHQVNVNGTTSLLESSYQVALSEKRTIKFIFPSTIAVYGIPDLETKKKVGTVKEDGFNAPITMYGINKLYCERVGTYYSKFYKILETRPEVLPIDFRCVRFPGIISAMTVPSGGTSDYAPEMIHSAARGEGYESFVRSDTVIPFMVMPDAVKALLTLTNAPKEKLTQGIYNVSGFSATAEQIAGLVNQVFPDSSISYNPDQNRQKIVDSWPAAVDDSAAKRDWGWKPDYDILKAFNEYLIPEIQDRYKNNQINPTG